MQVIINNGRVFISVRSLGMELTPLTKDFHNLTFHRLGKSDRLYLLLDDAIMLYEANPASKRWGRYKVWANNLAVLRQARDFAADEIAVHS